MFAMTHMKVARLAQVHVDDVPESCPFVVRVWCVCGVVCRTAQSTDRLGGTYSSESERKGPSAAQLTITGRDIECTADNGKMGTGCKQVGHGEVQLGDISDMTSNSVPLWAQMLWAEGTQFRHDTGW